MLPQEKQLSDFSPLYFEFEDSLAGQSFIALLNVIALFTERYCKDKNYFLNNQEKGWKNYTSLYAHFLIRRAGGDFAASFVPGVYPISRATGEGIAGYGDNRS